MVDFVVPLGYEWNNRSAHYDEFEMDQNYKSVLQNNKRLITKNGFLCVTLISL